MKGLYRFYFHCLLPLKVNIKWKYSNSIYSNGTLIANIATYNFSVERSQSVKEANPNKSFWQKKNFTWNPTACGPVGKGIWRGIWASPLPKNGIFNRF